MTLARSFFIPTLFGLALMLPASTIAEDLHHQPDATTGGPTATDEQSGVAPSIPMLGMTGQQSQGMPMMDMMGQGGMGMMGIMGMMGQGAMPMVGGMANPGMPMADMGTHLEGRIAFLRVELGITEAQAAQWESFAQALRDATIRFKQMQATTVQPADSVGFLRRMELQEQWLGARLDGLKAVKAAYAGLQAAFSDDQKKAAEALLTRPVCIWQMGMM